MSKWQEKCNEKFCNCDMPNGDHRTDCNCATNSAHEGSECHVEGITIEFNITNNHSNYFDILWHATAGDLPVIPDIQSPLTRIPAAA